MAVQADYNSIAQQVYISYFGRPADALGLSNMTAQLLAAAVPVTGVAATDTTAFVNAYSTNTTIKSIVDNFGTSTESLALYGDSTTSNASFVNAIFLNVLGRSPLLTGLTFWSNALTTGAMTRGEAALRIMEGALTNTTAQGSVDAAGIANKTIAASTFTANQLTTADVLGYTGATAAATARAWLATVTSDAATLTAATASVATTITSINTATSAAAAVGTTFTLTTSADSGTTFTGTANNDTFNAVIGTDGLVANGTTLNPGDNLNGGNGTDVLSLSISGTNSGDATQLLSAVTLASIETLNISNFETRTTGTSSIDLANATGITTISVVSSSAAGDTAVTAVQAIAAAKMQNGAGDLSITYADAAVAGAADTQTLELTAVTAGTFTAAATTTGGVETLAITSSGSARNVLTGITNNAALETITVAGTQALTLGAVGAAVTSLDASANTGGLTATLSTTATAVVVGSAGNDIITAGTAMTTGSVDAGAGTADTLRLTADAVIASATEGAKWTNFETVKIDYAAATTAGRAFDNSFMTGVTGYAVTAVDGTDDTADNTATIGFTKLANTGSTLVISGLSTVEDGHALIVNVAAGVTADGTADDIAVTLGTSTAGSGANAVTAGVAEVQLNLSLTNFETVSVVSQGAANFLGAIDSSALKTLTITGDKALSIAAITSATALSTINASAATGDILISANASTTASTITGGTGDDTLIGGTKADSIDGGAGADSLTGAAGNDVIVGGAGNDTLDGGADSDNLSGGDGDDTFAVTTAAHFQGLLAAETIDGGAGNDTIDFTAQMTLVAADMATVTSIETIKLSANAANSITLADSNFGTNTSMTITDGLLTGGTLTVVGSALTAGHDLTITGNTSTGVNDSLVGGAGNDTFKFSGTTALEAADVVTGGAGTADTITLAATAAVTIDMTGVTGVERVVTTGTGTADADDVSITLSADTVLAASTTLTIDTSSQTNGAPDTLVDASALTTATKSVNVTTGAGVDTVTGGAGNDVITTGAGADIIAGGAGIDNLSGDAGDDTFNVTTAAHFTGLTAAETVSGGAGTDTLSFANALAPTVAATDLAAISSIEKITTLNTTTAFAITLTDTVYTANGNTSLIIDATSMTTGDLTVSASGLTAANSLTVEREDVADGNAAGTGDSIVFGAGNDTLKINELMLDNTTTTLTGGAGTDTLTLTVGTNSATTLTTLVTGFEKINFGADDAFTLTTVDENVASGVTFTVDGTALITTNALSFNGAAELDGKFSITGGAGTDSLVGGALADTITGGAGADTITGGKAADSLTGGTGADVFVYTSASVTDSTGTTYDTITDFTTTSDKISVTLNYSALSAGVDVNANLVASVADLSAKRGEFVYDTATSMLSINVNNDNLITTQDIKISMATVVAADVNTAITGSAFGDTLTGGAGVDTIVGGAGVDSITGGAGADSITIADAADADTIVFSSAATNGSDTITGFVATASKDILYSRAYTFVAGTAADTALDAAATANCDQVAEFGSNVVAVNATNAVLASDWITAANLTDIDTTLFSRLLVLDIGATVNLYYVENLTTADDASVTATLIGTFTDITGITAGVSFVATNFDFVA